MVFNGTIASTRSRYWQILREKHALSHNTNSTIKVSNYITVNEAWRSTKMRTVNKGATVRRLVLNLPIITPCKAPAVTETWIWFFNLLSRGVVIHLLRCCFCCCCCWLCLSSPPRRRRRWDPPTTAEWNIPRNRRRAVSNPTGYPPNKLSLIGKLSSDRHYNGTELLHQSDTCWNCFRAEARLTGGCTVDHGPKRLIYGCFTLAVHLKFLYTGKCDNMLSSQGAASSR